ncbi:MAG: PilT/PilU family type 4a pilus ATPase [Lachnospiraceae bacterium]|nr:PilT/PilU family type 4a pilus ATPase [Lachnospiraceae bacterium]
MNIQELIETASAQNASDVHLVYGIPPKYRLDGQLVNIKDEILTDEMCEDYARTLAGSAYEDISYKGELDLARTIAGERVRINLFRQQGHISAALRILSNKIPELESLGLPPIVAQFPTWQKGIILVTGETGSGKSTTLAAILDQINHTRQEHIITLEDPVEYIYQPDRCIINQREIGKDTESYSDGLRAALREDPDIILIGEMRDLSTIETAMTAAETGHLVFATLHTNTAADAIDRIVGVFPADRQPQIRLQLSTCLKAVLSQQLLVKKGGHGRVAACEAMVVTAAIRNLICEGKTPQMLSSMLSGAAEGSITMDNFLVKLLKDRKISQETALEACSDKAYLKKYTY